MDDREHSTRSRQAWADNLKVVLVAGVVVAHVLIAWTHLGVWVTEEPQVREPLLSVLALLIVLGALIGMPLFFFVAGLFTPASVDRKGPARFVRERAIRLLVPMALFTLLLSPPIEYVDDSNIGWAGDFWSFAPTVWWPPTPGPTWFLGVLFVFSVVYSVVRGRRRRPPGRDGSVSARHLLAAAALMVPASFAIRLGVPLGEEWWHLAIGQAPAWTAGFVLGVLAGEQDWFRRIEPHRQSAIRYAAWLAMAGILVTVVVGVTVGLPLETFFGGGTWPSLLLAVLEAVFVVAGSVWLVDLFRRRFAGGGALARELSRSAYATFFIHQLVLVGLVLAIRQVTWPPEAEFLTVAVVGVAASFAVGALLVRLPGLRRVL